MSDDWATDGVAPSDEANRFISGGYFMTLPVQRPEWMSPTLLPDRIVSVSGCFADLVPDTWSISWTRESAEHRRESAQRFGLDEARCAELTAWCTSALEAGTLSWPGVFHDPQVAMMVKDRFLSSAVDVVVLGVALPRELAPLFLEATGHERSGDGVPGVVQAIHSGLPPDATGFRLGFDVLGYEWGGFHSYLCNGLEKEFHVALGVEPNRHGLFDRLVDADRCAEHAELETTGAEPVPWFPWSIRIYAGDPGSPDPAGR